MPNNKSNSLGNLVVCRAKRPGLNPIPAPVFIPEEDRFLHTLILGPAGCSKSRKALLPLIKQDAENPDWGFTVLDAEGELPLSAFLLAKETGRDAFLFDPTLKNSAKFNPLAGNEVDVVENFSTIFRLTSPDSPEVLLDMNEQLVRNAVKVLKRLDASEEIEGKYATLIRLNQLLQNSDGQGRDLINAFSKVLAHTDVEDKENADITYWFLNMYFPEDSKIYEDTSRIRSQVSRLVSNEYLRNCLNPDYDNGERNDVNIQEIVAKKQVLCVSTAQAQLRDLSRYLSLFFMLSFESSVARQDDSARQPHALYIGDIYDFSHQGLSWLLTHGIQYRIGIVMSAQSRKLMIRGETIDDRNFIEQVSSNTKNVILSAGISREDLDYYAVQFAAWDDPVFFLSGSRRAGPSKKEIEAACKWEGEDSARIVCSLVSGGKIQPPVIGNTIPLPDNTWEALKEKAAKFRQDFAI